MEETEGSSGGLGLSVEGRETEELEAGGLLVVERDYMVEVFEALYTLKDTEILSPLSTSSETTGC